MEFVLVIPHYLVWHYSEALTQIRTTWLTLLWYIVHLFSLPLMVRTLFSPWHRMLETKKQGGGIEAIASQALVNVMSRVVGACIKIPIIIIGVLLLTIAFFGIVAFYLFWLLLPFITVGLCVTGIYFLSA